MKSTFYKVFRIKIGTFDSFLQVYNNTLYNCVPYVILHSLYLEVNVNNAETSYLNLNIKKIFQSSKMVEIVSYTSYMKQSALDHQTAILFPQKTEIQIPILVS